MHTTPLASALTIALAASTLAGPPATPHLDLWLHPDGPALLTGSITEGTPGKPFAAIARVFGADLGDDPEFPFSASEPGFQSLSGRATAGASFAFAIPGPLLAWNSLAFAPSDHTMTLEFGPASVTSTTGFVDGFTFTTQPSGLMHIHFNFTLNGPVGDPAPGIYALPMVFEGVTPLYAPAPTAWIVFNLSQDESEHDAAMRFAESYLACGIDLSADGHVDATDIGILLGAWGSADPASDVNHDGTVDASDLAELLVAWGFDCPE